MFIEAIKNKYTITDDSWYLLTVMKVKSILVVLNISKAPKYLMASFQVVDTIGAHNRNNNSAIFEHVHVKKKLL